MMNTLNTENPIEKPFRKTGDPVDLTSESPLHPRRKSRRIMVGPVPVGGGAPISVQSMTNTLTANVPATLQQIAELTAAGVKKGEWGFSSTNFDNTFAPSS